MTQLKSLSLLTLLCGLPMIPIIFGVIYLYHEVRWIEKRSTDGLHEFEILQKQAWTTLQILKISINSREKRKMKKKREEVQYPISERLSRQPSIKPPDKYGVVLAECQPGPPGLPGRPGIHGENGIDGVPGRNVDELTFLMDSSGLVCIQCPAGPPGPPGIYGSQGIKGPPGSPGFLGKIGAPGRIGQPGLIGDPGVNGSPGSDGIPGSPGDPIMRFLSFDGPAGLPGPPGSPGLRGQLGLPAQSESGPPGSRGTSGRSGKTGLPGYSGLEGLPGDPGNDAGYCPCPRRILDSSNQMGAENTSYDYWVLEASKLRKNNNNVI